MDVINNVTEMSKDRVLIADLFYVALEAIQEIKGDYLENEVFDAFKNVSQIAKPGEESASLILVNFLNDLYQHRKLYKCLKCSKMGNV